MNLLAFDTATNACTAALSIAGRVFSRHRVMPRAHASLLLLEIQALCDEAGVLLSSLDAIAFGAGPGSFMGVRLAASMAQGLAFGLNIPVISISTLQTIAQTVYEQTGEKNILPGWDARMHEMYWGGYQVDERGIARSVWEDRLSKPAQVDLTVFSAADFVLAGNAWEVYKTGFSEKSAVKDRKIVDMYPEAASMIAIAAEKYQRGEMCAAADVQPAYFRQAV